MSYSVICMKVVFVKYYDIQNASPRTEYRSELLVVLCLHRYSIRYWVDCTLISGLSIRVILKLKSNTNFSYITSKLFHWMQSKVYSQKCTRIDLILMCRILTMATNAKISSNSGGGNEGSGSDVVKQGFLWIKRPPRSYWNRLKVTNLLKQFLYHIHVIRILLNFYMFTKFVAFI